MRPLPDRRHRANPQDTDTHDPLPALRRRCTIGAYIAAAVFVAAFITNIVRHTPDDDATVLGVEIAATGSGVLCGATAAMAWLFRYVGEEARADDLSWAFHMGTNVADAYRTPVPGSTTPRGPNVR